MLRRSGSSSGVAACSCVHGWCSWAAALLSQRKPKKLRIASTMTTAPTSQI